MTLRPAASGDLDDLSLQAEYYREDGYAHRASEARAARSALLAGGARPGLDRGR